MKWSQNDDTVVVCLLYCCNFVIITNVFLGKPRFVRVQFLSQFPFLLGFVYKVKKDEIPTVFSETRNYTCIDFK